MFRSGALRLLTALVFGFGVVIHGAVHAVVAGESFAWNSPAHVIMGAVAIVAIVVALRGLHGGARPDRRRRYALMRADLARRPTHGIVASAAGMFLTATAIMFLEGVPPDPERLLFAAACGLCALAVAFVLLLVGPRALLAIVAALAATAPRDVAPRRTVARPARKFSRPASQLVRSGALRAPPLLITV